MSLDPGNSGRVEWDAKHRLLTLHINNGLEYPFNQMVFHLEAFRKFVEIAERKIAEASPTS